MGSSTSIDRIIGLSGNLGIKIPVRCATTANITLSGFQTIDGIAVTDNASTTGIPDRVLVKNQTDGTQNGIYDVNVNTWTRSADFDGNRDATTGTLILAISGTTYATKMLELQTVGPIIIGTTILIFGVADISASAAAAAVSAASAAASAAAAAAAVASLRTFDIRNYGAVCDGVTDDTTSIQAAINAAQTNGGGIVVVSGRSKITGGLTVQSTGVSLVGMGRKSTGLICSVATFAAITIGGISSSVFRCAVQNMFISAPGVGVKLSYNTAQCYVDDLYITGGANAITVQGDYTVNPIRDSINHHIRRIEAEAMTGDIFYLYMCGDIRMTDLQTPNPVTATAYGVVIDSGVTAVYGWDWNLTGCKGGLLINDGTGISPNPTSLPTTPRQMYFHVVQGDSCHDFGIQVQRGYQINFFDCWSCGCTNGAGTVVGDGTNGVFMIGFFGHRANGNAQDGIRFVTGLTNLRSQIIGGQFLSNGTSSSNGYDGIAVQPTVTGLTIHGAHAYNDTAQGLNNTQRYGLNLVSGAIADIVATGNNFKSNLTAGINNNSTSPLVTLANNEGFNEIGFAAPPTVPSSTTVFTNPYGRPMVVSITGGTVTAVKLDTITVAPNTSSPVILAIGPGHTISITYSSVPSWSWIGM